MNTTRRWIQRQARPAKRVFLSFASADAGEERAVAEALATNGYLTFVRLRQPDGAPRGEQGPRGFWRVHRLAPSGHHPDLSDDLGVRLARRPAVR